MIWLFWLTSSWAIDSCTLNGESINLNHGGTTAGKSGQAICKDEAGKLHRKITFKNGEQIGPMTMIDHEGQRHEYSLNAKGNRDGKEQLFAANGTLLEERTLNNSTTVGLARTWWPNGKRRSIYFNDKTGKQLASMDWKQDGQLSDLRCGEEAYFEEDREYCGFKKDSVVEFPATAFEKAETHTYRKGLKINVTTWFEYKKPHKIQTLEDNKLHFKEHYQEGGLKFEADQLWKGRGQRTVMLWEKEYFMNGKLKLHSVYENGLKKHKKEFYDDGKLKSEGDYLPGRYNEIPVGREAHWSDKGLPTFEYTYDDEGQLSGVSKIFDEAGKLRIQSTFEKGQKLREIEYSATGEVVRNDEYYPDGSRK